MRLRDRTPTPIATRRRTLKKLALLLLAVVTLGITGCGGGDGDGGPRDRVEAPRETTRDTTGAPDSLPPEFVRCMAERGYQIESSADIHSAPAKVVQACFEAAHQGGGAP
jgi:sugar/nucleoside kinase (ribokinase family)